jgi:hypothetical protein
MMLEMLFITAYLLVVSILFVTTLSIIKQFGFIYCLRTLILALIIVAIMIGVFMVFANTILLIFMKMLIMWLMMS